MTSLFSRLSTRTAGSFSGARDFGQVEGAPATGDLPRPLDGRAFSKLYKKMDRVVKSLQNSRMNLSRSPPCLIDTLPDIYLKFKEINTFYETPEKKPILDFNDFFYITVNNIFDKCKRVNQLFKDHKEEIYLETSDARKQLVNLTIVIAYIYADLKALFPDGQFSSNFRIAKEDAERWWKETFPEKVIVPWVNFRDKCASAFSPLSKLELSKLKSTIDLTCNDHVSIFEFDVFTRLFAPWPMLMKNFNKLTFHPGYMASATFENVKAILSRHKEKPGSYVFRMSCTKLGFWSIGYVTDHSEQRRDAISQIVVRDGKPIVEALVEGSQKGFYLYPNGEPTNPDLTDLLHVRPKPQFQVTEAQFEEYSMIGSTFQECKICNIRDKDIRLDLCGHFMCSKCLNQWLSKGTGCPFCRCEIRSTQSVEMQPFNPPSSRAESPGRSVSIDRPPPPYSPPDLPPGYGDSPTEKSSVSEPIDVHPILPLPRKMSRSGPLPQPPADGSRPGLASSSAESSRPQRSSVTSTESHAVPSVGSPVSPPAENAVAGLYINLTPRGTVPLPPVPDATADSSTEDTAVANPPAPATRGSTTDETTESEGPARTTSGTSGPSGPHLSSSISTPCSPLDSSLNDSDVFPSLTSSASRRVLPEVPPVNTERFPTVQQNQAPSRPADFPTPKPRPKKQKSHEDDGLRSLPPPPPPPIIERDVRGLERPVSNITFVPSSTPDDVYISPNEDPYHVPVEDPYHVPVESVYHVPAESVYHVPREDSEYNVLPPREDGIYNVPRTEEEECPYNIPPTAQANLEVSGSDSNSRPVSHSADVE